MTSSSKLWEITFTDGNSKSTFCLCGFLSEKEQIQKAFEKERGCTVLAMKYNGLNVF